MPIIRKIESEIETLKGVKISKKIFEEMKSYCEHFDFSLDEFISQASEFVLKKDPDWKKVKNSLKAKAPK